VLLHRRAGAGNPAGHIGSLDCPRIKLEHVAIVADGSVVLAELQQSAGQTGPRPHVGSRLEKPPEMPGIFLEPFASERQLAGFDASSVKVSGLLGRPRLLGQEVIGVRAQRRNAERLAGQRYPGAGRCALPTRRI